jgi:hypothetical protein
MSTSVKDIYNYLLGKSSNWLITLSFHASMEFFKYDGIRVVQENKQVLPLKYLK